ncbi:MAG: EAL domain-containing protein [Clostridium lundense]|nr:EAL domain-containing protein [Clostridium lundense]
MNKPQCAKQICTALVLLIAVLLSPALPAASAAGGIGESITVGVPTDRCPIFYLDANSGEIIGIGADLMRAAAEQSGYAVTFRALEEDTLKEALDSDAYDLVMPFGSAVASASGQPTIVSENLFQTPFTLVTKGSGNLPPLNELRVGMLYSQKGVSETVGALYPGIETVLYETMPECVKALRSGRVDALLQNSYIWSYVLQKPSYQNLVVQPSAMFSMDFRAGTLDTPEGRERINRLNDGIAALNDPLRQAIVLDYTTRPLYRRTFSDYLYANGIVLLLSALLFVAVYIYVMSRVRAIRKKNEEKMRRLIDHDPLTDVLSLNGFRKRVGELLNEHPGIPYMLIYCNFTNFKFVNDRLGMKSGDELLCFFAEKITKALSDMETIGRIEGDRFAILRKIDEDEQMMRDDIELINAVRNYFIDRGGDTRIQLCAGVYILTPQDYHEIDVDHMLDFARVAERRVHEIRKDGYEFYNQDEWDRGRRNADIVSHLPVAIRSGEIQVWYQPQVNAETGEIIGTEALCRWNHAKLGWLRPADFISMLEDCGLIFEIDRFVWDKACQDLHRWNQMGKHRTVSVNLSRSDIQEGRNITWHFQDLLRRYELTADQLHVEITETAYARDPKLLIDATVKLQKLGIQVEMDDFGSGYSSLHMLKSVPVDRIKLDLDFLNGEGDAEKGRIIINRIIQMVQELGMTLIVEGVEESAQAQFLQSCGCVEMQGFHFYKPMTAQDLDQLYEKGEKPAEND